MGIPCSYFTIYDLYHIFLYYYIVFEYFLIFDTLYCCVTVPYLGSTSKFLNFPVRKFINLHFVYILYCPNRFYRILSEGSVYSLSIHFSQITICFDNRAQSTDPSLPSLLKEEFLWCVPAQSCDANYRCDYIH